MEIKVAIYEDNDALREGLITLIKSSKQLTFIGAFPNSKSIIENCKANKPDVILMDIDMPGITGIEATQIVKNEFPEINIMMLTVFENRDKIFDALRAGATGYLLKKSTPNEIIEAIIQLVNGGSPMTGAIARKVLEFFTQPDKNQNNEYILSSREIEILKRLVAGDSYKMIADNCCISINTVNSHINSIYHKLSVNSKSEAVVKAIKERLI